MSVGRSRQRTWGLNGGIRAFFKFIQLKNVEGDAQTVVGGCIVDANAGDERADGNDPTGALRSDFQGQFGVHGKEGPVFQTMDVNVQ